MPALAPPALAPALPSRPSAVAAAPCPGGGAVREWGEESGEGGIDLEVETPRAEAVGGVCQVGVKVAGRLRACSAGWAEIGASAEVMAMVTEGYRLPLTRWPPTNNNGRNHTGAREHAQWLRDAVAELLVVGAASEVYEKPRVLSPINVLLKPDGVRLRMVLDTRWLNEFQRKIKFKYETLDTARGMFELGDWMFLLDFTSGYYHVDIHPEHRTLLGFEVEGRWYVFNSLPFGLRDACRAFTVLVRQPMRWLRERGRRGLPYIDDLLFCLRERDLEEQRFIVSLFEAKLGFIISMKKPEDMVLSRQKQMLGIMVDTTLMRFSLPPKRAEKFALVAAELEGAWAAGKEAPARAVARVTGHVASMVLLLGREARLFSRYLSDAVLDVARDARWEATVPATPEALAEVRRWQAEIPQLPHAAIVPAQTLAPDIVLVTDAGDDGTGGGVLEVGGTRLSAGERAGSFQHVEFTELERAYGSALRELAGAEHVCEGQSALCAGRVVEVRTDSLSACYIDANGGSQVRDASDGMLKLHAAVLRLHAWARRMRVPQLTLVWYPREHADQQWADDASKVEDTGDWWLLRPWFEHIDALYGPHDVDCFASARNAQLARYHTRWWAPATERIDTFSGSWGGFRVWLAPEPTDRIIMRCVCKIREDRAYGSLLVPVWPGKSWWPLLFEEGHGLARASFGLPPIAGVFGFGHAAAVVNPCRDQAYPRRCRFVVVRFDMRA